ncbi:MAG: hypothetical protein ACK4IT_10890 [Thioalkalivibrionaceae bacterium]
MAPVVAALGRARVRCFVVVCRKSGEFWDFVVTRIETPTLLDEEPQALRTAWEAAGYPQGVKSVTPVLDEEGDNTRGKATGWRFMAREEDADFFRTSIQEPGGIAQLVARADTLEDHQLCHRKDATRLTAQQKPSLRVSCTHWNLEIAADNSSPAAALTAGGLTS